MLTISCQLDNAMVMTNVITFAAVMLDSSNDRATRPISGACGDMVTLLVLRKRQLRGPVATRFVNSGEIMCQVAV